MGFSTDAAAAGARDACLRGTGGDLLERLQERDWPGNVRELYYVVATAIASGDIGSVTARSIGVGTGDFVAEILAKDLPLPRARQEIVLAFERLYMQKMLDRYGGSVRRAAEASGIGRRYFQMLRAKK